MPKPTTIIFSDKEVPLREICRRFKAEYVIWEDVTYKLPESWKNEQ